METSQLEELLLKIQKLQSIMINVATRKADFNDAGESYTEIYEAVDLIIELLQEDGVPISNPNSFKILRSWYTYWANNLSTYALRRKYVCDLYIDVIDFIEGSLQKQAFGISTNEPLITLESDWLIAFLSDIQQLQSILTDVATGAGDIDTEDADYMSLYQKILSSIRDLQQGGLPLRNPNNFSSLWHWHNYWSSELEGYGSRQQFVIELYTSIVKPIQKALQKHQQRSTSTKELTEDLQRRFKEQASEQLQALNIISTGAIEQNTNTSVENLYTGITQALNPDSKRTIASQPLASFSGEDPLINFVVQSDIDNTKSRQTVTQDEIVHFGNIDVHNAPVESLSSSNLLVLPQATQTVSLESKSPKVFISYSHDSQEHKDQILELADRLRQDGVDCNIDQYEESPPEGWHRWMLNQVEGADFVLIAFTEQYDQRFRGREEIGKGKGVTWEGGVIIQELYNIQGQNSKFIPITLNPEDENFVSSPLHDATSYSLYNADGYELLYRRLTNQPKTRKPELGKLQTLTPRDRKQLFPETSPILHEEFKGSDRSELADLLKRSGRANSTSRRPLCRSLGLDPGDLNFVAPTYSDKDFAIELVNYLFETGRNLIELCNEVEPYLHGQYAQKLKNLCKKIQPELRRRE